MKPVLTLTVFIFIFSVTRGVWADNDKSPAFRVGISANTIGTVKRNDYIAAFKSWVTMIGKEKGLPVTAEAKVVDAGEALQNDLEQETLEALTLTVEDLMRLKIWPESVFLTCRENEFHVRYTVIVRGDSGINSTLGLKGRKIVTHDGNRMILARPWLELLLRDVSGKPMNGLPADLIVTDNASKSIFQVFFRQAHAALVTRDAFDMACELNPQLRKELIPLSVSQPLIPTFFMLRPTYRGAFREKLEKAIAEVHTTPGGRQVLAIFQSSRMEKHPRSVLDPTRRFVKEYRRHLKQGSRQ